MFFLISFLWLTLFTGIHSRRIALPRGAQVEGVTHARGTNFFAADLLSGNILLVDAKSGLVTTAIRPGPNRTSAGMYASREFLFVAGGGPIDADVPIGTGPGVIVGSLNVYDIATGATVASCVIASEGTVVNDVVADRHFAYYTDSGLGLVYKLSLRDVAKCEFETIELPREEFEALGPPPFSATANGVVKYKRGLIISNTRTQTIYFLDLENGNRLQKILPNGALEGADGLEIVRRRRGALLYVAQNSLNGVSIWKLRISKRVVSARRMGFLGRTEFEFPTTVAIAPKEGLLFVPNSRIDQGFASSEDVLSVSVVKL